MRISIQFSPNKQPVDFNYIDLLIRRFHQWLGGNNEKHGEKLALYSFSWLQGKVKVIKKVEYNLEKSYLDFPEGAKWVISAWESDIINRIMVGIFNDHYGFYGMKAKQVWVEEPPQFGTSQIFRTISPILVKRYINNKTVYFTYDNPESDTFLTETLQNKLKKAGLDPEVKVSFVKDYPSAKTRLVTHKNIQIKVNQCPVKVEGTPEQIEFAWNVGIGNSTGIGFGAIEPLDELPEM
ncbi:MAG: CRISPR-associated endoribonuclease Cas6 [Bacteroidia bacterium]|nr:CRISPR-associated endoribonuclease Cas6 [Bacteroidia bacterium]MDW8300995.1 CRISPR-associated endoribonuclease Cas6 [Bacteroidia bacterium]